MTPAEEAFRKAKLEQYNQMRHGLYQQIVGWSRNHSPAGWFSAVKRTIKLP